jgi:hypothetical protein
LCGDEESGLAGYGDCVVAFGRFGVIIVQGFEVFLELEGRVEL